MKQIVSKDGAFRKHDEVLLSIGDRIVGAGTLHKVFPYDNLQGETLGDNRVAVLIDDAFDSDCDIPYPINHLKKLRDAKDYTILQGRADLQLFGVDPQHVLETTCIRNGIDPFPSIPDSQVVGESEVVPNPSLVHVEPIVQSDLEKNAQKSESVIFTSNCTL